MTSKIVRCAAFLLLLPLACSRGAAPAEDQAPQRDMDEPVAASDPEQPSSATGAGDGTNEPAASAADPTPANAEAGTADAAPPHAGPPPSRDVVYRVTPEGLVVDADGMRFKPSAKSVRLSNGGYGIQLEVTAEVTDGRTHGLLSSQHGQLSLAAVIRDKNDKEVAHHTDTREAGAGQQERLQPGATVVLARSWPSGSVKGPLWWGQKVRLMVGLWGLGAGDEAPRPLKKLFVVDMVAGAQPRPLISPP